MQHSGSLRLVAGPAAGALLLLLGAACASAPAPAQEVARFYPGVEGYHRPVSTSSAEAQRWFDQGLLLAYGFNHDEAIRSFREAARLDPDCAMAWWGIAYANGTDVNNPDMSEAECREAYDASRTALQHLDGATPVERGLVQAVAARYAWPAPADRKALDQGYADAMQRVWRDAPDDPDVATLYAESLMLLQPWDYWTPDGQPLGRIEEVVHALERGLAVSPGHPGLNHFYIHAVEASSEPTKATASADRLRDMVPGCGHLVHMPSHIYINTGRYADAVTANQRAIAADEAYLRLAPAPGFYSLYFLHNIHFLTFAAMMEGNSATALTASRRLEKEVPPEFLHGYVKWVDGLMPVPLHVLIRFGRWEEILKEPEFPEERLISRATRAYARAVALANLERPAEARTELAAFDAIAAKVDDSWLMGVNPAPSVLAIARSMAEGEILWREGKPEEAYAALRKAVEHEDSLTYDEPPGWMQPARHALGALLLAGGHPREAEAVYRRDLEDNPENAWSLLGLEQAVRAQGRTVEADALQPRREAAWRNADVEPEASCYCGVASAG